MVGLLVLDFGSVVEIVEERVEEIESWPLFWLRVPALSHDVVELVWALHWFRHAVAARDLVQDFPVHHSCKGQQDEHEKLNNVEN